MDDARNPAVSELDKTSSNRRTAASMIPSLVLPAVRCQTTSSRRVRIRYVLIGGVFYCDLMLTVVGKPTQYSIIIIVTKYYIEIIHNL